MAAGFRECQDQDHACSHAPGAPAATKHRLATSRAPRPHQTSQPGRGAPPRRSVKARTRAGGFFRRATACALTYSPSARRGEAQARTRLLPSSPHGTPLYVGDAIMAPPLLSPRPIGGASAGPDGRRVRVRARAGVSSATDDGHEHSALLSLAPADTVDPASAPMHRIMHGDGGTAAQGFTSNPTDLCLCPSQSACLSVRSVHPFLSRDGRSIDHRSCPACTAAPRPNRSTGRFLLMSRRRYDLCPWDQVSDRA